MSRSSSSSSESDGALTPVQAVRADEFDLVTLRELRRQLTSKITTVYRYQGIVEDLDEDHPQHDRAKLETILQNAEAACAVVKARVRNHELVRLHDRVNPGWTMLKLARNDAVYIDGDIVDAEPDDPNDRIHWLFFFEQYMKGKLESWKPFIEAEEDGVKFSRQKVEAERRKARRGHTKAPVSVGMNDDPPEFQKLERERAQRIAIERKEREKKLAEQEKKAVEQEKKFAQQEIEQAEREREQREALLELFKRNVSLGVYPAFVRPPVDLPKGTAGAPGLDVSKKFAYGQMASTLKGPVETLKDAEVRGRPKKQDSLSAGGRSRSNESPPGVRPRSNEPSPAGRSRSKESPPGGRPSGYRSQSRPRAPEPIDSAAGLGLRRHGTQ